MPKRLSRREFLETSALAGAAATGALSSTGAAETALPTRPLGHTGERVTILALGCGSRLLAYEKEEAAVAAINLALDIGIRYLDTAYGYGNGRSETWDALRTAFAPAQVDQPPPLGSPPPSNTGCAHAPVTWWWLALAGLAAARKSRDTIRKLT